MQTTLIRNDYPRTWMRPSLAFMVVDHSEKFPQSVNQSRLAPSSARGGTSDHIVIVNQWVNNLYWYPNRLDSTLYTQKNKSSLSNCRKTGNGFYGTLNTPPIIIRHMQFTTSPTNRVCAWLETTTQLNSWVVHKVTSDKRARSWAHGID